jgi:hypothetical protein
MIPSFLSRWGGLERRGQLVAQGPGVLFAWLGEDSNELANNLAVWQTYSIINARSPIGAEPLNADAADGKGR